MSNQMTFEMSDSIWHPCRDGKLRRIPAPVPESVVQRVAARLPAGVDGGGACGGFPLAAPFKGRTQLLKGYGNSIVPDLAAVFIRAALNLP